MAGPLDGVRIVDLTTMISGPYATMILGDQGAEVIKVESPGLGDLLRYFGTTRGGMSAFFATSNRNKRSVVLNLKERRGVEVVRQNELLWESNRYGRPDERPDLVLQLPQG